MIIMKKALIILWGIFPQLLAAQTKDAVAVHSFRAGDVLNRVAVSLPGNDLEGENGVWDLQCMDLLDNYCVTVFDGVEAAPWIVTGYEKFSSRQYLMDGECVSLLGRYSHTSRMTYDIPEQIMHFPMNVGDSIQGIFGGTGSYSDKLYVREYGSYKTKADASGCLILPENDTLSHVFRLITERLVFVEAYPIDSMKMTYGDSIPEYCSDSICRHIAIGVPLQRIREQRWYAEGYRYPVLESIEYRTAIDGKLISKVALFYPPSVQKEQLHNDEENEYLRSMIARGEYSGRSGGGDGDSGERNGMTGNTLILDSFSQNNEAKTVTARYSLGIATNVRAILANSMGVVYHSIEQFHEAGSEYTLTLSYNGLPHGQYIVYISAGGQTHTAKFSTDN